MSNSETIRNLFDRWERVWHQGECDLDPSCVAPHYIHHDEVGNRTVTREAYAAEFAEFKKNRPDMRIAVYDHALSGDRAWYRFTMKWTDQESGELHTRAGMLGPH
jgi:SnoaL-like polyketide cyclase